MHICLFQCGVCIYREVKRHTSVCVYTERCIVSHPARVLFIRLEKPVGCQVSQSADQEHTRSQNQPHLPLVISQRDGFFFSSMSFFRFGNAISLLPMLSEPCKETCGCVYINSPVCELEINPVGSMPSDNNCFYIYIAAFWCEKKLTRWLYRKAL